MKIERLIGIIFYLINRECVTTNELAQKFEVSRRTILRDIDTLTLAGIPIYSELGVKGGYAINKDFKVDEKIIDSNNKEYILLALNSLRTVYGNNKVIETYEKMKHLYSDVNINALPDVDFSVVTENPHIMKCVDLINKAIKEQRTIKFIYTNSAGNTKEVFLNPLHTYYKWYSWYAFGYDTRRGYSYKVDRNDKSLLYGQEFFYIHLPDQCDGAEVTSAVCDDYGRTYLATASGIQVCDYNGRSEAILPLPGNAKPVSIAWGEEAMNVLYILCDNGNIYKRELNTKGTSLNAPMPIIRVGAG